MFKIIVVFLLALSASRAEEGIISAEILLKGCESVLLREDGNRLNEEEAALAIGASSYLAGFLDCVAVEQGLNPKVAKVDLTKEISPALLAREVATHIRDTPALRKEGTARMAIYGALLRFHAITK